MKNQLDPYLPKSADEKKASTKQIKRIWLQIFFVLSAILFVIFIWFYYSVINHNEFSRSVSNPQIPQQKHSSIITSAPYISYLQENEKLESINMIRFYSLEDDEKENINIDIDSHGSFFEEVKYENVNLDMISNNDFIKYGFFDEMKCQFGLFPRRIYFTPIGGISPSAIIDDGLRWLASHQEADGHWDSIKFGGKNSNHDVALTSLAILAFFGGGNSENRGVFKKNVRLAIKWINKNMINSDADTLEMNQCINWWVMAEVIRMTYKKMNLKPDYNDYDASLPDAVSSALYIYCDKALNKNSDDLKIEIQNMYENDSMPLWDDDNISCDWIYWYLGALEASSKGSKNFQIWRTSIFNIIRRHRVIGGGDNKGSWDPIGKYQDEGRVFATTMEILCLQVNFLYPRIVLDKDR
jgi:hypothetical protein